MKVKPSIFQHPDLNGSSFLWSGNSTGILLLHGFTATTVEVRQMAGFLHEKGFMAAGPLLPGHGGTIAEMNQASWQDWIKSVEDSYAELQKKCKKVFVLGESMGGLLALNLAIVHPETAGAMLFAPALKVPNIALAGLLAPFKQFIYKKNVDESMAWQGFNVVPLHAASQLVQLQTYMRRELQEMVVPTLIFQGKLDRSIDPISSVDVLESIHSKDKELIWLENSSHCILLDKQLKDVENLCFEFIDRH
jgi:carboxylesterase